jgi:hypothetical protein
MAAGDVASISGLGSALRSDCEAGLPTETGSGLIGAGAFDILRRKVPSARRAAWGRRKSGADRFVELQSLFRSQLNSTTYLVRSHGFPWQRFALPAGKPCRNLLQRRWNCRPICQYTLPRKQQGRRDATPFSLLRSLAQAAQRYLI